MGKAGNGRGTPRAAFPFAVGPQNHPFLKLAIENRSGSLVYLFYKKDL